MNQNEQLQAQLQQSQARCQANGGRLTAKRSQVLSVLLMSDTPLSAYEIADRVKSEFHQQLPIVSVYRMLEFLAEQQLVHKLLTLNKFVSCGALDCQCHSQAQFLICQECHQVEEVLLEPEISKALQQSADANQFSLASPQLELLGCCKQCSHKS
ncbi:Fur family transcriptional regulator [Shewanella algae]|uniref:Fur family transcriptional regulator n=1 Tax=Shewanella algae TaxID=38313 RepID=UPI003AAA984F